MTFFLLARERRGFSLVELLIVVAILGILSSLAIAQFSVYRQRVFNAVALSDLNNLQKTQGSMATDWREFGITTDTGLVVSSHGNGLILQGPGSGSYGLAGLRSFMQITLSNQVGLVANTDIGTGFSFVMLAKHIYGNRVFGVDSDVTGTYFQTSVSGLSLSGAAINITSLPDSIDITGWFLM